MKQTLTIDLCFTFWSMMTWTTKLILLSIKLRLRLISTLLMVKQGWHRCVWLYRMLMMVLLKFWWMLGLMSIRLAIPWRQFYWQRVRGRLRSLNILLMLEGTWINKEKNWTFTEVQCIWLASVTYLRLLNSFLIQVFKRATIPWRFAQLASTTVPSMFSIFARSKIALIATQLYMLL